MYGDASPHIYRSIVDVILLDCAWDMDIFRLASVAHVQVIGVWPP